MSLPQNMSCKVYRQVQQITEDGLFVIQSSFNDVVLLTGVYRSASAMDSGKLVQIRMQIDAVSMLVRSASGLLRGHDVPRASAARQQCKCCGMWGHEALD